MSNEPVAWILGIRLKEGFTECLVTSEKEGNADIPLYTHPAELTDEEIISEWSLTSYDPKTFIWSDDVDSDLIIQFARALLRKAQEK